MEPSFSSETLWAIGIAVAVLGIVGLVLGLLLFGFILKTRRMIHLAKSGVRGTALVQAARETGVTVNDVPRVELKLEVTLPNVPVYVIDKKIDLRLIDFPKVQPGMTVNVIADTSRLNDPGPDLRMKHLSMHRPLLLVLLSATFLVAAIGQTSELRWYKGNTHTHTLNTDGQDVPYDVAKWYREHGYNFAVITDHEYITNIESLNTLLGRTGAFLVISGQEVTDRSEGKPVHANGLGLTKVVMPSQLPTKVAALQKDIDNIRAAGGIPQLNHPNFGWALSSAEIKQLKGLRLMEIYNGHPLVNNLGGGGQPSAEAIWDELLTAGMTIYGIADDDVHQLRSKGEAIEALPGQAWIYVRAPELTSVAILTAIDNGDFYASTGVELSEYKADKTEVSIKVKATNYSKYRVQFIGRGGKILQESLEPNAVYKIKGNEGYVRVKVLESNGKIAWTQPIMLSR